MELYLADCLDILKQMPEKSIDLAIVDPPYGIGVGSMPYTNGVAMVGNALAKRRDYSSNSNWDAYPPPTRVFRRTLQG